jgi:hypothetical protein
MSTNRRLRPHPRLESRFLSSRRDAGSGTVNALCAAGVVSLVVLGNHGAEFDVRQTMYASRENCVHDWGDEESCRPTAQPTGSWYSGTYVGPRYYWDPNRSRPVIVGSDGSERVATTAEVGPYGGSTGRTAIVGSFARGGFGGIGRGFSSGRGG